MRLEVVYANMGSFDFVAAALSRSSHFAQDDRELGSLDRNFRARKCVQ